MNFDLLLNTIQQTHSVFQQNAVKAVNVSLTIRNWLIGYYIVEFEQGGEDLARYGENLLLKLSEKCKNIKGLDERSFRNFRVFYSLYPQIEAVIPQNIIPIPIRGSLTTELQSSRFQINPPIGILMCTKKGKKLVEYALSGMDEKLFVSKYMLELPSKEILTLFLEKELENWNRNA